MAKHPFLSDAWFEQARSLAESNPDHGAAGTDIRMNLKVTATPFGADRVMHLALSDGAMLWDEGHLDAPDVSLVLDYVTAKQIFVGGNPQAAVEAFMAGRITVSGDLVKLMAMQSAQPGAGAPSLALALQAITE